MGVLGLTTYINERSDDFFEPYELHDEAVVVDGCSLASVIFNAHLNSHSAFGGDYDHYDFCAKSFFTVLTECRITPIVVFDGGYEKRKLKTVRQRKEHRVASLQKVTPHHLNSFCFPLMMRQALKNVLIEMGVVCLQSDFEADVEIAALAKKLHAPVLSTDSDFYIYDVKFLPLSMIDMNKVKPCSGKDYKYINCSVFCVKKFLNGFGETTIDKALLPLLAALLGNDYISRSEFSQFYENVRTKKSKWVGASQARVAGLIKWLKGKSLESATKCVIESLPRKRRKLIGHMVKRVIKSYTSVEPILEAFLPSDLKPSISVMRGTNVCDELEALSMCEAVDQGSSCFEGISVVGFYNEGRTDDCSSSSSDEPEDSDEELAGISESSWYVDSFRMCGLDPCVYTMLHLRTYFCVSQIEDYEASHAGDFVVPLVRFLGGLILGDATFDYYSRVKSEYKKVSLTTETFSSVMSLPPLNELNKIDGLQRKLLLLEKLEFTSEGILNLLPDDWKLIFIAVSYWTRKCTSPKISLYHIHAVCITFIVINVVFSNIGYCRNKNYFLRKYGTKLKGISKSKTSQPIKKIPFDPHQSLLEALSMVTLDDCIYFYDMVSPCFHLTDALKSSARYFNKGVVHANAQLQSCIEIVDVLNSLLGHPFRKIQISHFLNSTFFYNMTLDFKRRSNIPAYVNTLFAKTPTLFNCYQCFAVLMSSFIPQLLVQPVKIKKKKRKNEREEPPEVSENEVCEDSDTESCIDKNNKFYLLDKLNC